MTIIIILFSIMVAENCSVQTDLKDQLVQLYKDQHKAIMSGDLETIAKNLTAENAKMVREDEDPAFVIEMLQLLIPPLESTEFLDLSESESEAVITATAVYEGETSQGDLKFRKEEGQWKIDQISWSSSIE